MIVGCNDAIELRDALFFRGCVFFVHISAASRLVIVLIEIFFNREVQASTVMSAQCLKCVMKDSISMIMAIDKASTKSR